MKGSSKYGFRVRSLWLSLVVLFASSCSVIHDDYSNCPPSQTVIVKAYTAQDTPMSDNAVTDVTLFIYDENETYIDKIETTANTNVAINFPGYKNYIVVAWGNAKGGNQTFTLKDGLNGSILSLNSATRAASLSSTPDDLFYGKIKFDLKPDYVKQTVELPVKRKVAAMDITIRNLKDFTGDGNDDFSIIINDDPYSLFDFNGSLKENQHISYKPDASFKDNGDYYAPNFNVLPNFTDHSVTIDIYRGETLIASFDKDDSGNKLVTEQDMLLNVLITLNKDEGKFNVEVVPAQWNRIFIWKSHP